MSADDLEVTAVAGGLRLRLRVRPGSRREGIVGVHGGALKLAVSVAPERGKANDRVVELLAERLGVSRGAVTITAGTTSPDKVAVVSGLGADELRRRLAPAIA